jgi:hypothetical protein
LSFEEERFEEKGRKKIAMQTCELAGDRTGDPGISSEFDRLGLKLVDRNGQRPLRGVP